MTVSELAARLAVGMPALSNHLARLRTDELVTTEHRGRQTYYSLANPGIKDLLDVLRRTAGGEGAGDIAPADSPMSQLREARSCYDHLAGRLGVELFDLLLSDRVIEHANDRPGSIRDGAAARWFHTRLELGKPKSCLALSADVARRSLRDLPNGPPATIENSWRGCRQGAW
jgi:DNA-binding MarR family transcriptional regulator